MRIMNPYVTVGAIYANYIMQSIAVTVIMQFSFALTAQLNTDLIGLGFIASGIGIGKVFMMFIGGLLSDTYGRKPCILIGMVCYIVFFAGLLFCSNVTGVFFLTILAGVGNAFLDTGSMPALTELFPASASSASVLIKVFISIGTLILPLIATVVYEKQCWYGLVLIGFVLFLLCNAGLLFCADFSIKAITIDELNNDSTQAQAKTDINYFIGKPSVFIEGSCLIIMGFTISATFVVIMQWLPDIAMYAAGIDQIRAKQLISDYSMGSILAVLFIAYVVKNIIKPIYCIILLPFLSAVILGLFLLNLSSPLMCKIVAFGMGFTAAGGVLQLSSVVMQQLFPRRKGFGVGLMYTLSGFAFMIIPLVIPKLIFFDVRYAVLFNFAMAVISTLLGCIVLIRFRRVIPIHHI